MRATFLFFIVYNRNLALKKINKVIKKQKLFYKYVKLWAVSYRNFLCNFTHANCKTTHLITIHV